MKSLYNDQDVRIEIDKFDHFPKEVTAEKLVNACGLLLDWSIEYFLSYDRLEEKLFEFMQNTYRFPMAATPAEDYFDNGIFRYPGDPPLYPVARISSPNTNEEFYIYQHAIVLFITHDGKIIYSRMD